MLLAVGGQVAEGWDEANLGFGCELFRRWPRCGTIVPGTSTHREAVHCCWVVAGVKPPPYCVVILSRGLELGFSVMYLFLL
jgi:hypothetical protein